MLNALVVMLQPNRLHLHVMLQIKLTKSIYHNTL